MSDVLDDAMVGRYYDAYVAHTVRDVPVDAQVYLRGRYIDAVRNNSGVRGQIRRVLSEPSVVDAERLAAGKHAGQFDKAGAPYILHVRAVAEMLRPIGDEAVMAGLLHDIVEDTDVTLEMLGELGYPETVVAAVGSVTIRPGEGYFDMVHRAAADPLGRLVKLAANMHNSDEERLAVLDAAMVARLSMRHRAAREILLDAAGPDDDEEDEPKICVDCGVDTAPCKAAAWDPCPDDCDHTGRWEWYMVLDAVWVAAGAPSALCIGCLERRLGRELCAADFADLPINEPHDSDSPRLAAARSRLVATVREPAVSPAPDGELV